MRHLFEVTSTFLSVGKFLQMRSAHPITAWPSQTGWGKGNIAISSFTYPYRALSHLWFTLLKHSFSSDHFHRGLSAWIRLFASLWDETELHSQPPESPVLFCFSSHEPADICFQCLEVALGEWPDLISDDGGKNPDGWKVLLIHVFEIHLLYVFLYCVIFLQHPTNLWHFSFRQLVNINTHWLDSNILQCGKHVT